MDRAKPVIRMTEGRRRNTGADDHALSRVAALIAASVSIPMTNSIRRWGTVPVDVNCDTRDSTRNRAWADPQKRQMLEGLPLSRPATW